MRKDLAQEKAAFILRIVKEFLRLAFDDLAFIHENDLIGHLPGKAHLMSYAQHRHTISVAHHHVQHFLIISGSRRSSAHRTA